MCIGYNFALLEAKIFLCHLLYRYHFEKEGDGEVETDPFFQLMRYAKFQFSRSRGTIADT